MHWSILDIIDMISVLEIKDGAPYIILLPRFNSGLAKDVNVAFFVVVGFFFEGLIVGGGDRSKLAWIEGVVLNVDFGKVDIFSIKLKLWKITKNKLNNLKEK